jgi:hypothetical protein
VPGLPSSQRVRSEPGLFMRAGSAYNPFSRTV